MKTLWIVSGGVEAVPGIKRAKEMGLYVVVSDGNPNAPGYAFADERQVVSTYDVEASVEAAMRFHKQFRQIDGVVSIAADVPLTVASIAVALDLPGISIETARLACDKLAMKHCFEQAGIPIPWFSSVESVAHLNKIIKERGFPLVIKPVDSRGARGVLRLTSGVNLDWAFQHAKQSSQSSRVFVEEYIPGPQVSTESVLLDGNVFTPGFSDRNYEYLEHFSPYIIENGGQQPSVLEQKYQEAIAGLAEKAAREMGIFSGIAKGDMVLTSNGPKVIEIAARLSGGWFCTDQIPLATGVDLVNAAIRLALGEKPEPEDLIPKYHRGVAIRYFFPKPGRVTSIQNHEKASKITGVHKLGFFVSPGDFVEPINNHTKRAGFVITHGNTREEAVAIAQYVVNIVKIETEVSK